MRRARAVATALFGLSGLLLAGCVAPAGSVPELAGPQLIAPEQSILQLPEELAQARLAVRREVRRDLLEERVVLDNDTAVAGENAIVVQTRWRGDPYHLFTSGRFANPHTSTSIDRRVEREFRGWQRVSPPLDRVNRHGPYRYIEAAADDVRCVLAWQMVDATAALTGRVDSYALDFRFCDTRRDADALLALFDRLELRPYL